MRRFGAISRFSAFTVLCLLGLSTRQVIAADADDAKWVTIKGRIVWDGDIPKQAPIVQNNCPKLEAPLEDDWIIDPKTKAVKDVYVWIRPTGLAKDKPFPQAAIHPSLKNPPAKAAEIDQPCCRFIPHVQAVREGQQMVIKNSAPIAHNAKWSSSSNGDINPLLAAGAQFALPKPLVWERSAIEVRCNIHPWMSAWVRVFDHPYYAVTDEKGNFEIKLAPEGKYSLFVSHPKNGYLGGAAGATGKALTLKAGATLDVGDLKMKKN